jgi:hypothetical protein
MDAGTKRALERVLELQGGYLDNEEYLSLPETRALFNMIKTFPWLLVVAQSGFNEVVAKREMVKAAIDMGLLERLGGKDGKNTA